MATRIELPVGEDCWALAVRAGALVEPRRAATAPPVGGPRELVRTALAAPLGLGSPLSTALTPDDHVAVVIDPGLPHLGELLAGVLEQVTAAGIDPVAVTLIAPPGAASDAWLADLPDEFADVTLETHVPGDRKKLAYLATTKGGRRVYLNRSLVEAEAVVVLSGRGYDPLAGYLGGEGAIFPALSGDETRGELATKPRAAAPEPDSANGEAAEVAWLLGMPFFVQVIRGPGDGIAEVVAGLPGSTAEGVRRQDARWRLTVDERPDLVVAAVAGDPGRADFPALAKAAANGGRVVKPGGRVVVLSTAAPPLGEGAEALREIEEPDEARKVLAKQKPADWPAAHLWVFAARRAHLFVASGWPDDVAEGLYATPLASAAEVQRLIDAADRVLILPDADKVMAEVAGDAS